MKAVEGTQFKKGYCPWNKGLPKLDPKVNKYCFNSGNIKLGHHLSVGTEFKKGYLPWNKGLRGWKPETIEERDHRAKIMRELGANGFTGNTGKKMAKSAIEKTVEANNKLGRDLEYKARALKASMGALWKRPPSLEIKLMKLIQKYKLPYAYCGNASVFIGGKTPDFSHQKGPKIVLEVANRFHHQGAWEKNRIAQFRNYGFKCLVIYGKRQLEEDDNIIAQKLKRCS